MHREGGVCSSGLNLSVIAARCHLPYRGEALAFREASPLRQRLPYQGQRRRPPPAAETGSRCWGRGQQDASGSAADAGSRNPGAKHLWRDGQAHAGRAKFLYIENSSACYRGQQLRNNILVKLLLISVAGHYFLRYIRLSAGSKKWPGLPKPLLQGEVARRRRDGEVVQRRVRPL